MMSTTVRSFMGARLLSRTEFMQIHCAFMLIHCDSFAGSVHFFLSLFRLLVYDFASPNLDHYCILTMEQPGYNPLSPRRGRRGFGTEGKNLHDIKNASSLSALFSSPESASPRRMLKFTKDKVNACLTPMLEHASKTRGLYTPSSAASSTSTPSSNRPASEDVVGDHDKWQSLKTHMRNTAKGGGTAMGLGENLHDLIDSASSHDRKAPPSPRRL